MAEYIEREKVVKRLMMVRMGGNPYSMGIQYGVNGANGAIELIKETPAADVAPVVHGCWKVGFTDKENKTTGVECSECNAYFELELFDFGLCYNYCPNCGARMDGE